MKAALQVAELTYIVTRRFPSEERMALADQMRRAAVSIGSNIAEGCGRSTEKPFLACLAIASGSASELEIQCRVVERLNYVPASQPAQLRESILSTRRMLTTLTVTVRSRVDS